MRRIRWILLLLITCSTLLFTGCKGNTGAETPTTETTMITEEVESISTEVDELYQNQTLMLELLVNENCVIEDTDDSIAIFTPDGYAYVMVSFIPGIQNLESTGELIPAILEESGAIPEEVLDGVLFGERAKHCSYSILDTDGNEMVGIFAVTIANSSLYMVDAAFGPDCTEEDVDLINNVFTSLNVLKPKSVDATTKTTTYETKYPEAKPANEKKYVPVDEWIYLPYYYYAWDMNYDYSMYDSSFYEPDWNYYSDGNWWSWDWDDEYDWEFYNDYGDWYSEDYYSFYDDYYDYDPYSDPGDYYYYDDYSDPGDYYNYDDYSDPGDYYNYDDYSDPGDYYNYDDYSDPGDYYNYDDYSDPGDYYNYDDYSDPGDYYY